LEQLLRREIAVVLTDVSMPELDGFELAAMIREHPRFQTTAIIFVSAIHLTSPDHLRGYAAGAVDYLPVPIVPELMRAKVKVFADLHRKTRQLERLNAELERRVEERTAQLEEANAALEQRVLERTREREAALAQVQEMQKLESLGQLTGGVAHDFNNLLGAIMGNLELLERRLPDDPRLTRLLGGAMAAAKRGATLTARLLAFARRQELKPEAVCVTSLVEGMLDMLSRTLGPGVRVVTDFYSGVGPVRVDPNQLELALLNLALNGRDAMPNGGSLIIGARRADSGEARGHGLPEGSYVCVFVADTGVGMDADTLKHATEPFFTTKGTGKGTGLGLAMVHGLVAQSGGTIRIVSAPAAGTTVELLLPVAEGSALGHLVPASRVVAITPPSRVLLVDDDPLVLAGTTAMLEDLGHTVVETASAALALETLARGGRFDLVITDHAMPTMTGSALAQRLQQHWPDLPVILATGYADLSGGIDPSLPRLNKPYRLEDLAAAIAATLARPVPKPTPSVSLDTAHCA
jgi:signal transduction histidine kinase/ActR/RegA family two-component response regulator